jgi:short-subunit dehydrogenase
MILFRKPTFDEKVILIAGGASGMGRELAYLLREEGGIIVVANRKGASLDSFRQELITKNFVLQTVEVDMTEPDGVRRLADDVVAKYGRIDYFYNCVGIVQGGEVKDVPLEVAGNVIHTNVDAIIYGSYVVYRQMVAQGSGHIINLASAAGLLPTPLMPYYTASKYAVVGFTHALRAEAGAYGVKVSVACPGFVKTPIYDKSYYDNVKKQESIDVLFHRIPIQSASNAAKRILKGVRHNRATIHTWHSIHFIWILYRLFPNAYLWAAGQSAKIVRRKLQLHK